MKLGMMNNPLKSVYEEAAYCGRAGFDFLDLTLEGPCAINVDVDQLGQILEQYGLFITGHTDPCLPYAYPVQDVRDACLKEMARCAQIFSALGATVMNIHPCYLSPPAMRKDRILFHIEALKPIFDMAASYGLTLVLENFKAPFDKASTFKTLITEVPGLKLHLDVGHANLGRDDHGVFCRALGEHLCHVHFSDNRARSDDHMPLGVGTVDWKDAVQSLKAAGYDDTITLEIFCNDPDMQRHYLNLNREWVRDLWKAC